jgi:hypothetical protein
MPSGSAANKGHETDAYSSSMQDNAAQNAKLREEMASFGVLCSLLVLMQEFVPVAENKVEAKVVTNVRTEAAFKTWLLISATNQGKKKGWQ